LAGYPARWATVRELLVGLARARIVEIKTANPEYYDRLGVEDPGAEGASGLLVTVAMGGDQLALIIGKLAEGRSGRFLRPAESAQSLLSDFDAEVPREASGWVEREVADIAAADVAEVEIEHPDGDRIHVLKAAQDDADFMLENLPAGREPASNWAVNSLGSMLSALQLDSVDREAAIDWDGAVRIRLRTFAGMEVRVDAAQRGEEHWVRLAATGGADVPGSAAEPDQQEGGAAADDVGEPGDAEGMDTTEGADTDTLRAAVDAFNARVAGWAYRIPAYKYEAMTKRLEGVLKSPEEGTD